MVAQGRQPRRAAGAFAKRTVASTRLSKRIGWLNNNAGLQAEIRYSEVRDALARLGEGPALQLLKRVEHGSGTIRDPTGYLISSARRNAEGGGGGGGGDIAGEEGEAFQAEGEPVDVATDEVQAGRGIRKGRRGPRSEADVLGRIERRVSWLNANAGLTQELSMDQVGPDLARIGIPATMEILKRLEESPKEVNDPNNYVLKAIARRDSEGPDSRGPLRRVLKRNLKPKPNVSRRDMSEMVRKRVAWLNKNGGLAAPLDFASIGPLLVEAGKPKDVMELLKTLETKAAEVRDPNAYVARSAKRLAMEGRVGPIQREEREEREERFGRGGGGRAAAGGPDAGPSAGVPRDMESQKVIRRVSWLNEHGNLAAPLLFDRIAPLLMDLDPRQAMDILKQLEDRAAEVRDPTAYVAGAARRALGGGLAASPQMPIGHPAGRSFHEVRLTPMPPPAPPPAALPPPPPPRHATGTAEEKLLRRIAWLNDHVPLAAPLDPERVAPELLAVSREEALDVLNDLEEHYATVRDPTAYVIANTRRLVGSLGGRVPDRPPPRGGGVAWAEPQGPPIVSFEEKLERRLAWLNRNVCPDAPLDFDRLMPLLLSLSMRDAMEILKNFETNAGDVRDPTSYVAVGIRKAMQGAPTSGSGRDFEGGGAALRHARGPPARPSPGPAAAPAAAVAYGALPSSSSSGARERTPRPGGKGRSSAPALPPMPPLLVGTSPVDGHQTYYKSPQPRRGGGWGGPYSDEGSPALSHRSSAAGESAVASAASEQDDAGRLRRRIDWLNSHVRFALPLIYDEVAPHLLRIEGRQAMEVLKRLEMAAQDVRDPNGYVVSAARRKGGGRGQSRRKKWRPVQAGGGGAGGAAEGGEEDEEEDEEEAALRPETVED